MDQSSTGSPPHQHNRPNLRWEVKKHPPTNRLQFRRCEVRGQVFGRRGAAVVHPRRPFASLPPRLGFLPPRPSPALLSRTAWRLPPTSPLTPSMRRLQSSLVCHVRACVAAAPSDDAPATEGVFNARYPGQRALFSIRYCLVTFAPAP